MKEIELIHKAEYERLRTMTNIKLPEWDDLTEAQKQAVMVENRVNWSKRRVTIH